MTQISDVYLLPFVTDGAQRINAARLAHFEALGLIAAGNTVADFGGGPGLLAERLNQLGFRVTLFEPRPELVSTVERRNPGIRALRADVLTDDLVVHGRFDYGFAYGLLYHLSDPLLGLRNISRAVDRALFLETQVTDSAQPLVAYVDEPNVANQAVDGWGTRPSPPWLVRALQHVGFPYIYQAPSAPEFPDFRWIPRYDNTFWRDDHPLRVVLIASRDRLGAPLQRLCEPLSASNRPILCIGEHGSRLEFGMPSAGFRGAAVPKILADSCDIDHVLDAGGHVQGDVLKQWALERTENLVVDGEHADIEGILESFPHLRTARVSRTFQPSTGFDLIRAVQQCRANGWRLTDARSGSGRVSIDLERSPLPPVLIWSPLEYEVEPCNEAVVRRTDDGLLLETPAGEWSYGVILRLRARGIDQVRLSLECTGAPCEVATLTTVSEVYHAATILPAGDVTAVALRIPPSLYGLVIRTGPLRGPAFVTVRAVSGITIGQTAGSV
jgi:SAM-dependent methyltransferase